MNENNIFKIAKLLKTIDEPIFGDIIIKVRDKKPMAITIIKFMEKPINLKLN